MSKIHLEIDTVRGLVNNSTDWMRRAIVMSRRLERLGQYPEDVMRAEREELAEMVRREVLRRDVQAG